MFDPLPFKSLKIGYQNIEVRVTEPGILGDDYGHFYKKKNYIAICADQNAAEAVNTLLHEVLHAIYRHFDLDASVSEKEIQEHKVTSIANGLTQVFLDNPAFHKWIGDSLANS